MTAVDVVSIIGGTVGTMAAIGAAIVAVARWKTEEAVTAKSIDGRIGRLDQKLDDGFEKVQVNLDSMKLLLVQRIEKLEEESDLQRTRYHDELAPLAQRVIALEEKE